MWLLTQTDAEKAGVVPGGGGFPQRTFIPGPQLSARPARGNTAASALKELSMTRGTSVASAVKSSGLDAVGTHRRSTYPCGAQGWEKASRLREKLVQRLRARHGGVRPWAATSSVTQRRGARDEAGQMAGPDPKHLTCQTRHTAPGFPQVAL